MTGRLDWPFPRPIKKNQSLINRLYKSYFNKKTSDKKFIQLNSPSNDIQDLETIKKTMFNSSMGHKIKKLWQSDTSMNRGDIHQQTLLYVVIYHSLQGETHFSWMHYFANLVYFVQNGTSDGGDTTYGGMTIAKVIESSSDARSIAPGDLENDIFYDVEHFNNDGFEAEIEGNLIETNRKQYDLQCDISSIKGSMESVLEHIQKQETFNNFFF